MNIIRFFFSPPVISCFRGCYKIWLDNWLYILIACKKWDLIQIPQLFPDALCKKQPLKLFVGYPKMFYQTNF